jgi:RNA polymerase sigma-70 factor (ECF subfamily)
MPIDAEKLEKLLTRYWPVLVAWLGGARHEAEDVVQAAFIKLAAEEPPPSNCVAWLFTVSKRLSINQHVSQLKRRSRESRAAAVPTCSADSAGEFELRELLNTLDDGEREIVVARIWGGLTFDEIALAQGYSKASAWRLYQSGLSKLRQAYGESTDE